MTYLEAADKLEEVIFKHENITSEELLALAIAIKELRGLYRKMESTLGQIDTAIEKELKRRM